MFRLLTFFFLCISLSQNKQYENKHQYAQDGYVDKFLSAIGFGVFNIEIEAQSRISRLISLKADIGITQSYVFSGVENRFIFSSFPRIGAEPRFYYNMDKRLEHSKSIKSNSGNFIGLRSVVFPEFFKTVYVGVFPTWGFRKSFGIFGDKDFFLEFSSGIGVGGNFSGHFAPDLFIDFKIGHLFWSTN